MRLNRTSEWNVMTIWISQELPLFNFEHLDILCAWIGTPSVKLWPFELLKSFHCSISSVSIYYVPESDIRVKFYDHSNFSRASVVQFWAPRWVMSANRTSEWNVMTIRISRELPLFNFERLAELCPRIGQFRASWWVMSPNRTSVWKVMTIRICRELPLFNFERLGALCPRIEHPVKIYDHSNLPRASVVQFRASWYIMRLNRTSLW